MRAAPGRLFAKVGAEGVYCAAIPELGLGIALKCDDGSSRGCETMVAGVISKLFGKDEASATFAELARKPMRNWNKIEYGFSRPAGLIA